jgi:hypothetical protein
MCSNCLLDKSNVSGSTLGVVLLTSHHIAATGQSVCLLIQYGKSNKTSDSKWFKVSLMISVLAQHRHARPHNTSTEAFSHGKDLWQPWQG